MARTTCPVCNRTAGVEDGVILRHTSDPGVPCLGEGRLVGLDEVQRWLDHLRGTTRQRAEAQELAQSSDDAWRSLIRHGLRLGYSAASIAEAAGVSTARVYQIRDGRR